MGSKSAPSAPDYTGAAVAQGASSEEVNRAQTYANRPTQTTPWGTSTWEASPTIDPSSGASVTQWNQNITLSPDEQAAFDSQSRIRAGLSQAAESGIQGAADSFSTPLDYSSLTQFGDKAEIPSFYGDPLPDRATAAEVSSSATQGLPQFATAPERTGNALRGAAQYATAPTAATAEGPDTQYSGLVNADVSNELSTQSLDATGAYNPDFADTQFQRQMSLQEPLMQRDAEALEVRLRNQGLRPGTEAYDNAMGDLQDQQGEIRSRAAQDSMRLGADEQQRQFGRELTTRQLGGQEVSDLYGRRMGSAEQQDTQRQQQFQESQVATAQQLDNELRAAGFNDQQRAQMVQEKMASNEQQFQQSLQQSQFSDSQRGQMVAENLSDNEQQFQQTMQQAEFQAQQRSTDIREKLAGGDQLFRQQMEQANYQNALRQAQVTEEMQKRGQSLNEINALIYGQQIGMPEMPNFAQASKSDAVNYLGAADSQGQFANQRYSTALSPINSGLTALGGFG